MHNKEHYIYTIRRLLDTFNYEIQKQEARLNSANKRYQRLVGDMKIYIGTYSLVLVFALLIFFFNAISSVISFGNILVGGLGLAVVTLFICIYVIALPFILAETAKVGITLFKNKENTPYEFDLPAPVDESDHRNPANIPPEHNIQIERQKLAWILSKYYMYRTELTELLDQVINSFENMDQTELAQKLATMHVYEDVGITTFSVHTRNHSDKPLFAGLYVGLFISAVVLIFLLVIL